MIPSHCRHMAYPEPGTLDFPKTCAVGIAFADVRLPGHNRLNGEPCTEKGRANGATCPKYAPWTPEEIAKNDAEIEAMFTAVEADKCICGATLEHAGARFWCPVGSGDEHVWGFGCNPRDGAPHDHEEG